MTLTLIDTNEITNIAPENREDNIVSFKHHGVYYVYYTDFVDAFYGMVEKYDITLDPYRREDDIMHKTGVIGKWDPEKQTAYFSDKWLKQKHLY